MLHFLFLLPLLYKESCACIDKYAYIRTRTQNNYKLKYINSIDFIDIFILYC